MKFESWPVAIVRLHDDFVDSFLKYNWSYLTLIDDGEQKVARKRERANIKTIKLYFYYMILFNLKGK